MKTKKPNEKLAKTANTDVETVKKPEEKPLPLENSAPNELKTEEVKSDDFKFTPPPEIPPVPPADVKPALETEVKPVEETKNPLDIEAEVISTEDVGADEPSRGRGRPPGVKNKPKITVDYASVAGMLFDMTTGTMSMIFGPEWQPRPPQNLQMPDGSIKEWDEKAQVVAPLAKYLETQEIGDIPPGIMLAVVVAAYSAPRLAAPNTKDKLFRAWLWLKGKIFRKK